MLQTTMPVFIRAPRRFLCAGAAGLVLLTGCASVSPSVPLRAAAVAPAPKNTVLYARIVGQDYDDARRSGSGLAPTGSKLAAALKTSLEAVNAKDRIWTRVTDDPSARAARRLQFHYVAGADERASGASGALSGATFFLTPLIVVEHHLLEARDLSSGASARAQLRVNHRVWLFALPSQKELEKMNEAVRQYLIRKTLTPLSAAKPAAAKGKTP